MKWLIILDKYLCEKQIGSLRMIGELSAFIIGFYLIFVLWLMWVSALAKGTPFVVVLCTAVGAGRIYYWLTRPVVKWFDARVKKLESQGYR